jgi:Helix-turn-helix domain
LYAATSFTRAGRELQLRMTPTLRKQLRQEVEFLKVVEESADKFALKVSRRLDLSELRALALKEGNASLAALCRKAMPLSERIEAFSAYLAPVKDEPEPNPNGPYTVAQAGKILNLPPRTVYDLCTTGKLQHRRHGTKRGTIRITQKAIDNYSRQFA